MQCQADVSAEYQRIFWYFHHRHFLPASVLTSVRGVTGVTITSPGHHRVLAAHLAGAAWLGHPSHQGMWDFYPSECFKQNLRLFTQWFTPGRLGKDFLNFVVTDCFELNKTKDGAGIRHGVTTLHTMLTALSWRSQGPASPCPMSLPNIIWRLSNGRHNKIDNIMVIKHPLINGDSLLIHYFLRLGG